MPALFPSSTMARTRRFLRHRKRGWIGVDVGAALTKMAQVERVGDEYRIAARWCLPAECSPRFLEELSLPDDDFAFARQLRQGRGVFRGKRAAAALSAGCTTHRTLDLPQGEDTELRHMVGEEIEADAPSSAKERCYDYWQPLNSANTNSAMVQLSVIDLDRNVALKVANSLSDAGLECRLLDGVPCALARAVQMFDPLHAELPRVILDIGYSATVFVAAMHGRPVFTRVLRGAGIDALLRPIQNSLKLTANESLQLVRRWGLGPIDGAAPADAAADVVHQLATEPVARWMTEIARTLAFLEHSPCALVPQQILFAGGGAFLRHLAFRLANETGVEVDPWRLTTADFTAANRDDSLFAVAAALSALAWEA